jgi:hypothetical protein
MPRRAAARQRSWRAAIPLWRCAPNSAYRLNNPPCRSV